MRNNAIQKHLKLKTQGTSYKNTGIYKHTYLECNESGNYLYK